jgi:putative oxidoreductase
MNSLKSIGKIVFAIPFLVFGVFHFMNAKQMAGMIPGYMPAPEIWVYITGAALILAFISIVINVKARLASILLAIMLLLFILMLHLPNAADSQQSMSAALKDLGLLGGALMAAGLSKK